MQTRRKAHADRCTPWRHDILPGHAVLEDRGALDCGLMTADYRRSGSRSELKPNYTLVMVPEDPHGPTRECRGRDGPPS